jgi:hypothetical protein
MALRIGKKNNADDWSEESLRQELAQISGQDDEAAETESATPASDDLLADFMADTPEAGSATPALDTPLPATDDAAPALSAGRPKISPILLAGGLVFLIVAIAVGVWLAFFNAPAEDTSTPATVPIARRPPRPTRPSVPPPATKVIDTKAKPAAKPTPKAKAAPVTHVAPGKAGIVPKAAKAPAVAPKKPSQAPRVEPVKGVPTPVVPPPGMAGVPGKGSTQTTSVQVVRPNVALSQQLKALWKQGAAAKHRGDTAGARRAWTKILQLHPGHPGIQDAINKLPR